MWSSDPSRSVDGHGVLPWVEPRKTRIGLGFISDATEGAAAAEKLRLANCGACPPPEMANAFERCGIDAWSACGVAHHWALGTGHQIGNLKAVTDLLHLDLRIVKV